jgi:hypothetical protein
MATTIQTFEGSVGIGTDNPSKTLHVQGGLLVTNKTEIQGNLTVSGDTVIINSNDITINDRIFGIGSGHVNHNEDTGVLLEHKDNGTYANVALVYHADEKRLSLGYTQNTLTDNHVLNFQDPTHLLKIDLRGNTTVQNTFSVVHDNMGIGTETPGTKLDVHGTANVGVLTTTSLSITSNLETPNLHVDINTSRVGIGTNTPLFNIDVHGKANVGALTVTSISGDGSQLTGLSSTLQEKTDTGNTTSNTLQFTNDITGLVTSSNIVVGGNVTATSFIGDGSALTGVGAAFTTSGSNLIRTSGNVGVGTDTPSRKLDIHGNLNLTKDFYTSNLISTEYSTVSAGVWSQVGADIDGEAANDQSGESVALSSDGTRLAVGGWLNDGTGGNAGHVRVFEESGGTWTQVGTDIDGEAAGDHFGWDVALSSNGTRLAAGGYLNDANGSNAGHVRVFEESGGTWTQVGGDIDGETASDLFGISVALSSDGTRVAAGAAANDTTGTDAGHVRVFEESGGTWTQVGANIDGEAASDYFGWSVALSSDGTRLAAGGYQNDGGGFNAGHVRVFDSPRYTKQTIKDVIFEIGGSNVYVDTTSGNVGVGTNTPYAKLHVQGSSGIVSSASKRYFNHSTNLTADTGSLSGMSIYANDHIVSGKRIISKSGTITASDRRIKQNIKDVKDDTALNILRLLKPKRYSYRDVVFQGDQPVWGFIAQEVENVLPYAVQTNTSYIPNIYDMATRGGDNLLTFTNFDTSNLESNSFTIQVYDENENAYTLTLKKIIDSKIIQVEEKIIDDELFVYGQRVENFKQLQKDAIFTIATSALQEVDKRLQIEKEKNDGLEERIIRLEKMFG